MISAHRLKNDLLKSPPALISLVLLIVYIVIVVLTAFGVVATDFATTQMENSYAPPSLHHFFGTDFFGRDVLDRAMQGTKIAFLVGFFSASIATLIGVSLGALGGYFGGWVDDFVVWLYTTLESIPYILLISAFAFALGQGLTNLYIALGLTGWVKLCRLIRSEFLKQKNLDYVQAAQAMGVGHFSKMFRHIFPNVAHLALIQFTLSFVFAIKAEVILSFLGLGVEPGTPSWGMMISDARVELTRGVWWNLLGATTFMFFLILSVNLLTDHLRSSLDPQSKSTNMNL